MDSNEQSNYNLLFAQRQEFLFIEYVRKTIDLEVRNKITSDRLELITSQLETSENLKNEVLSSLEKLSFENKWLSSQLDRAIEESNRKTSEHHNIFNEKTKVQNELNNANFRIKDLEREIERQNAEMKIINDENESLKTINKKKVVKRPNEAKMTEEDIF
jgi:chromosome segregation ATPase